MRLISRGFTLIELMVVITIVAILAAIVYSNVGAASPKARNAERQADIRNLQTAIEQYKQKNGRYPTMGCTPGGDQISSESDCSGNQAYITGLAPEFITVLPKDARRGTNPGYSYVTNTDGTSYKVMALGTVESETVTSAHPMKSCDTTSDICNGSCSIGAALQSRSYGLWGGYAPGATNPDDPAQIKTATAAVICK
jgi:type II secretion system protein G